MHAYKFCAYTELQQDFKAKFLMDNSR